MTKKIILASIAFLYANTLFSQYSNATLNGQWLLHGGPISAANAEADTSLFYVGFDGNGNIIDWENFGPVGGTDSVTASGFISMTLITGSVNGSTEDTILLSAQLTSPNYATMGPGAGLSKILNVGALTDSLVGVLNSPIAGQRDIMLQLNSQGQIISSTGLTTPVSGRVYADSGIFMGHVKTGDTFMYTADSLGSSWDEFTIVGSYVNDSLNGVIFLDGPKDHSPHGTVHLVRRGTATAAGILPVKTGGVPRSFSLSQNYPDPFNPTTTIRFELPLRSHVTLMVFNTVGQKVAELINSDEERGIYDVRFDASGLASGTYLYRLQAGGFVETKKLVVVK